MKNIAAIERIKKALKKENYICDDELAFSLFLSQNLEKPLLLEG
ncbi:MAG: MoxR family ATPase, partial [Deltaproteobacteria bacterium]|nr:MoxR family ATPase [Deltaproteobacteria bacterium]